MNIEIAIKICLHGDSKPSVFTSDFEFFKLLSDSNIKDGRNFSKLKKGEIINIPNSGGVRTDYKITEIEIEYTSEIDPNLFKYGFVYGQVGELIPYQICLTIEIKEK